MRVDLLFHVRRWISGVRKMGRKSQFVQLALVACGCLIYCGSNLVARSVAQEPSSGEDKSTKGNAGVAGKSTEKPSPEEKAAQEKAGIRGKPGSKRAVETRLKAAEKPKPATPIHEVEKTLFATRRFEQTVI